MTRCTPRARRSPSRRSVLALGLAALPATAMLALASAQPVAHAASGAEAMPVPGVEPAPAPAPAQADETAGCTVETSTAVAPGVFLAGDAVDVERTVRVNCAPTPFHIVLVLDGTAAMAGEAATELKTAMDRLVGDFEAAAVPKFRVGVVAFSGRGTSVCALTDDMARIRACVGRVPAEGEAELPDAMHLAGQLLLHQRDALSEAEQERTRGVVLVATNSAGDPDCLAAKDTMEELGNQEILTVTMCTGPDCSLPCLRYLATSPRFYFVASSAQQLINVFDQMILSESGAFGRLITLTETLPDGVELVLESVGPEPSEVLSGPTRIVWSDLLARDGHVVITYRVRPTQPGYQPLSAGMDGTFTNAYDGVLPLAFDVPWVRVVGMR